MVSFPAATSRLVAVGWFALTLLGCAAPGIERVAQRPDLPRQAELVATPFFPQDEFQCGPAALATSLNAVGLTVTPAALTPEVYLPARQGSLQIEMLAAARRHGAVAYVIPDRLDALLEEIAAGHPALVLQNLGLQWAPSWHYAVAVGYDLDSEVLVLRSGTERRQVMSLNTFQHTWNRSERWAFVALPPDKLPVTIDASQALESIAAFARVATKPAVHQAYQAAVVRWPDNLPLTIGLGNAAYELGQREEARRVFAEATQRHPDSGAAFNNLAHVLSDLGQYGPARAAAQRAVELGGPWRESALQTLEEIRQRETSPEPN